MTNPGKIQSNQLSPRQPTSIPLNTAQTDQPD
jgi:hypothetical protein